MKRSLLDITQKISRNPGKTNLTPKDLSHPDYWIFEAINCIKPRIVVCEYNSAFGAEKKLSIP
jgi:hypothetical protein